MKTFLSMTAGVAMAVAAIALPVRAQDFPTQPITIIVPYVPGGGVDIFARRLTEPLSRELGVQVVVDNRGGAGGNIGMQAAAQAAPDGYTVVLAINAQLSLNPALYPVLNWDPIEDFEPISLIAEAPYILVMHPDVPVNSIAELIEYEKANPGSIAFASAGVGSVPHLAGEMLNSKAGIHMEHIPYQGGGAVYPDLLAGRVQMYFATLATSMPHVHQGALKVIAAGSEQPVAVLPDVPTVAEVLPGFNAIVWYAVLAPKGTPPEIVARLNEAFNTAVHDPSLAPALEADAIRVLGSTPEELGAYIASELEVWAPIVRDSGATLN